MTDWVNGADVLLLVDVGPAGAPDLQEVGYQRDMTIEETNAEIDFSSKEQREGRFAAGRYGSTIQMDALYIPDDEAQNTLQDAMRAGTAITVRVQRGGTDIEEADAIITSLSKNFPDQDASTWSISLTVDGAWTVIGS